jgi:hypothetical protein
LCIALSDKDASTAWQQRNDGDTTLFGKGEGRHVFVVVGPTDNATSLRQIAEEMPEMLRRS